MKKITTLLVFTAMLGLWTLPEAYGQRGPRGGGCGGGWCGGGQYNQLYNPKTVERLSGEVISMDKIIPGKGMSYGVHFMLKTDKETISVHLGPGWFIENQDMTIKLKDKVAIKGSRVTFDGKPAIIAAEVKKGSSTLNLRDENGRPVWAGWRRG